MSAPLYSVLQAEELLARAKRWESSALRMLKAADDLEAHGYKVTISVEPTTEETSTPEARALLDSILIQN